MSKQNKNTADPNFENEVRTGLGGFPKRLSSKFIYDKKGDRLFQQIMEMPTYYLYDCEYEILERYSKQLSELFCKKGETVNLIDLGAGDGKKTKILLRYMVQNNFDFVYKPIDISETILEELKDSLKKELPTLKVEPETGEYFQVLNKLKTYNKIRKVILVLGSNIGNLLHPRAIEFMSSLKDVLNPEDLLFMGFDRKKNPQTILDAYNDKEGITAAFNRNILYRINSEFDADFEPEKFTHWEVYNPETGTAKSYLVATEEMDVKIRKLNMDVHFEKWETIHVEISQKYTDSVVKWLADESGLAIIDSFTDRREYYRNYIFIPKD